MVKPKKQPLGTVQVLLPTLFTVARLICGLIAVAFTFHGMRLMDSTAGLMLSAAAFDNAAKTIGFAILFDALDGKVVVPGPYARVMKKLVNKDALNRIALCACFLSALPIAQGAEPITIAMTADHPAHTWSRSAGRSTCPVIRSAASP